MISCDFPSFFVWWNLRQVSAGPEDHRKIMFPWGNDMVLLYEKRWTWWKHDENMMNNFKWYFNYIPMIFPLIIQIISLWRIPMICPVGWWTFSELKWPPSLTRDRCGTFSRFHDVIALLPPSWPCSVLLDGKSLGILTELDEELKNCQDPPYLKPRVSRGFL